MNSYRLNDPDGSRTIDEAAANIAKRTMQENLVKAVLCADMSARFKTTVTIDDNGIDNTGKLILDDAAVNANPDWTVNIGKRKVYVEVLVHSERYSISSFKETKLNKVGNDRFIFLIRESCYYLVDSRSVDVIREIGEYIEWKKVNGGKPSWKLEQSDLELLTREGYLKKFQYLPEALKIMDSIKDKAFA